MKKALPAIALGAVAAILARSGCTDSSAAPTSAPTDDAGSGEIRSVRVAALPIAETGALWAAMEEGIFEDHGIEVEVVPAQGGAQAIPALLSGDIQFAIGQPLVPSCADGQDLGVVIIGNYADSLEEGKDVNAVVSLADSGDHRPGRSRGKARLGEQPRRRRRRDHHEGRRGRRRLPQRRSSSSRSASPTPRPSSKPATSTPPGFPTRSCRGSWTAAATSSCTRTRPRSPG